MSRPTFRKKVVALIAIASVSSAGMPSVLAASWDASRRSETASGWSVEFPERVGSRTKTDREGSPRVQLRELGTGDLDVDEAKRQIRAMNNTGDQKVIARAARLKLLLDIASATTSADTHKLVAQLPVQIVRSAPTDGRSGVVKSFISGGKTRARLFVPAPVDITVSSANEIGSQSGPSASTGRWKLSNEGCYWDANDGGPDQCSPNQGRWKIGNSGCYWDGNDSGPNQCDPEAPPGGGGSVTCSDDEGEAPCATSAEVEDMMSIYAAGQVELAAAQADYDAATAEIEAYCSANPWACQEDSNEVISGPNSCPLWPKCITEAAVAGAAVASFAGNILRFEGCLATTAVLTARMTVGWGLTIAAGAFAASYTVGTYIGCAFVYALLPVADLTYRYGLVHPERIQGVEWK